MNILNHAEQEKRVLLKKRQQLIINLQALPPDRLCVYRNSARFKWYRINDSSQRSEKTYIQKKEYKLAQQLALKETLTDQLRYVENQLSAITTFINQYPSLSVSSFTVNLPDKALSASLSQLTSQRTQALDVWQTEDYEKCKEYPDSVTCSHHFRFAKKWGLPVQGRYRPVSAGYPRASPGSIAYR